MILPSAKHSLYYVEHCKIAMSDEHLCFIKQTNAIEKHFSIPYANTSCLLAGPGTSITQAAAEKLAKEKVMFAFTAGGGTPIYLSSLNEFGPTEYMQKFFTLWADDSNRLNLAKKFHLFRSEYTSKEYLKIHKNFPTQISENYQNGIIKSQSIEQLLGYEAIFAKNIYSFFATQNNIQFKRDTSNNSDKINQIVTQGNYLCYGIASSVLWILGISSSFPFTHGHTRRGGLIFDLADIIKPSIVLLNAEIALKNNLTQSEYRNLIIQNFDEAKIFSLLANFIIKEVLCM